MEYAAANLSKFVDLALEGQQALGNEFRRFGGMNSTFPLNNEDVEVLDATGKKLENCVNEILSDLNAAAHLSKSLKSARVVIGSIAAEIDAMTNYTMLNQQPGANAKIISKEREDQSASQRDAALSPTAAVPCKGLSSKRNRVKTIRYGLNLSISNSNDKN